MKIVKRSGIVLLVLLLVLAYVVTQANRRPSLAPYHPLFLEAAPAAAPIRIRFAGVSTLMFDDGETAFMTDGFFSRPGIVKTLFSDIAPDPAAIDKALGAMQVTRLSSVVVLHGHYDHALDAPAVAAKTGALLIGDESVLNVGRGYGLAAEHMRKIAAYDNVKLGKWNLTFIPSRHAPTAFSHGERAQHIEVPLKPPAHATAWKEGETWSLLVRHDRGQSYLVQGSAGYVEGGLKGYKAEVVFLGVGAVGKQSKDYRAKLWEETVTTVGAHRVIPVHWDDFWVDLMQPLRPMPYLADDFGKTMEDFLQFGARDKVEVRMPPLFMPFAPN